MADMPRDTSPPKPKPKPKARGAWACKYKAEENVYVGFCNKGVWGIEHGKEVLAAGGPPPKGETWVRFPWDKELFGVPKAAVWRTRRQAKRFLEKKRKEKEAGEEREGDDHEDADAEDGDGGGDGDGNGETKGMREMRVWGWRSPGWRLKSMGDGVVVGKGE